MRTLIVIPARLGSWRFPEKPLTLIEGRPMIEHVFRRAQMVSKVKGIVIATCDQQVFEVAKKFGARALMTSAEHKTAAERIAEAARLLGYVKDDDIIINVQGDEPVVPPPVIELTRSRLLENPDFGVANLVERIIDPKELSNPHRVKAILSVNRNLIFLSRQAVPSTFFDVDKRAVFYRLTCITAYRGPFLQSYCKLARTPIELIEGNDLMRVIEHDLSIPSGISPFATHPVDVPEDLAGIQKVLQHDEWFKRYAN